MFVTLCFRILVYLFLLELSDCAYVIVWSWYLIKKKILMLFVTLFFLYLQAVCGNYDCAIDNFHSLVDGKAVWCLLDYYFQKELQNSCSLKVFNFFRFLWLLITTSCSSALFFTFNRKLVWKVARHQLCRLMNIQMHCIILYYPKSWLHYWGTSQR